MAKNILFSFKKVEKHTISAGQGGGGASAPLALPCGRHAFFSFFLVRPI